MYITFGWYLDGMAFPLADSSVSVTKRGFVCGPQGLLNYLELRLALNGPTVSTSLRTAQLLSVVSAYSDADAFFARSFAFDAWSTTARLLKMRDDLVSGGWDGQSLSDCKRINVLAKLEHERELDAGIADRQRKVLTALDSSRSKILDGITVIGAMDKLPPIWQKLLQKLGASGCTITESDTTPRSNSGDLAQTQHALKSGIKSKTLTGDGTFSIIDADDELQAADVVAAYLSQFGECADVVILRGAESSALMHAGSALGLPMIGTPASRSNFAILQVLPLAFELAWRPLDPMRILEFITIAGGVIPASQRQHLQRAVAEHPGMGGPLWNDAWEKMIVGRGEDLRNWTETLSAEDSEKKAREDVAKWQEWFEDSSLDSDQMTARNASVVADRVQQWALRRVSLPNANPLYEVARRRAALVLDLIARSSLSNLTRNQLRNMVMAACSEVTHIDAPEASAWSLVDRPGQIWSEAPHVVWWGFVGGESVRGPALWTNNEVQLLQQAGIVIEPYGQESIRETLAWRQPLLNASKSLMLVQPRVVAGEAAPHHGAFDELRAVLDKDSVSKVVRQSFSLFHGESTIVGGAKVACGNQPRLPLPRPLREWNLPADLVTPRESESFSSMEALLGCSLNWTLRYRGRIWESSIQSMIAGEQLIGVLAHAVIRCLVEESTEWTPSAASRRASEMLEVMIPTQAAPLLLPGNGANLRMAKQAIPDGIEQLIRTLAESKLSISACEAPYQKELDGITIVGTVDLLLSDDSGNPVVLDVKWTRSAGRYRTRIKEGTALQLATYGWLVSSGSREDFAPAGFYLIRQKQLFSTEDRCFPQRAQVEATRNLHATWELAQEQRLTIMSNLTQGRVVAVGVLPPSEEPVDVLVEAPCSYCAHRLLCGVVESK